MSTTRWDENPFCPPLPEKVNSRRGVHPLAVAVLVASLFYSVALNGIAFMRARHQSRIHQTEIESLRESRNIWVRAYHDQKHYGQR